MSTPEKEMELYERMQVLANTMVVIIIQYVSVSNQTLCTPYTYTRFYVHYISIKLGGRKKPIDKESDNTTGARVFPKLADNRKIFKVIYT